MKNAKATKQTRSQLRIGSKSLLITGSILLALLFCQHTVAQDYTFLQGGEPHYLVAMEAEHYTENIPNGDVVWAMTDDPVDPSNDSAMMAVTGSPFATAVDAIAGSAVLSYKVTFTLDGPHYLFARGSHNSGGDDSYHAGLGAEIPESGTYLNFEDIENATGVWLWMHWCNPIAGRAFVNVPAPGEYDFKVYIRENDFRLDKLILTPDSNFVPEGHGPEETFHPDAVHAFRQNRDEDLFSLSTNLSNQELTVIFREQVVRQGKIELIDTRGAVLRSVRIEDSPQVTMNMADLGPGMYFVKAQMTDKSMLVRKFVRY